jgi:hypothetical protein
MDTDEVIRHAEQLIQAANAIGDNDSHLYKGAKARACDFLSTVAGPRNAFLTQALELQGSTSYNARCLSSILSSFIEHTKSGLVGGISPKRQAELDVVSDFLEQANSLLESNKVHPAAPAVLIGATLEEFVRTWIEDEALSLGNKKPGLDSYTKVLREAELISKQDVKDITSWSGIRNHAAHGEWEQLGEKGRIQLMLEGVNLFMRRYGGR